MNRTDLAYLLLRLCLARVPAYDRATAPGHRLTPAEQHGLAAAQREIDHLWAQLAAVSTPPEA